MSKRTETTPLVDTPSTAGDNKKATSSTRPTLAFEELPEWMKDNEWIRTGYRREQGHWKGCLYSLFGYWHNETVNSWSHILGSLAFLLLFLLTYSSIILQSSSSTSTSTEPKKTLFKDHPIPPLPQANPLLTRLYHLSPFFPIHPFPSSSFFSDSQLKSVTWKDSVVFGIFILSAVACLGCSATFHTGACHSQTLSKKLNKLDYVGIVILITGSFYPAVYYAFYCDPEFQILHLSLITLLGSAAMYTVISPKYATGAYRRTRTYVFIGLGLSAIFPVIHGLSYYGWQRATTSFSLPWLMSSGALYIVGALLYAERVPERIFPGSFDLIGSSHQIFHILILLAATCHYGAIADAFRFWHGEMEGRCEAMEYMLEHEGAGRGVAGRVLLGGLDWLEGLWARSGMGEL